MGDVRTQIVQITPAMAKELLRRNTGNRKLKPPVTKRLAGAMKRGEWALNGEAIKVSDKGRLMDGQHRLQAIIDSGVSIRTVLIEGLPDTTQETMDQGQRRTLADALKMRGERYVNELAAVLRIIHSFEQHSTPYPPGPITVQEGIYTLDHNPTIRKTIEYCMAQFPTNLRWAPRTTLAGLMYLFDKIDHGDAVDFMIKLRTGSDMDSNHAVFVLRETLFEFMQSRDPISSRIKMAVIIKAWNAYHDGEPMQNRIKFRSGGRKPEQFPRIRGLVYPGDDSIATRGRDAAAA